MKIVRRKITLLQLETRLEKVKRRIDQLQRNGMQLFRVIEALKEQEAKKLQPFVKES